MLLKDLKSVLFSNRGSIQSAIVYDLEKNKDVAFGCSIEYAVKTFGDFEVKQIQADSNYLVITI